MGSQIPGLKGNPLLPALDHALIMHPMPWMVEGDWTFEIIASDGVVVAKCMTSGEARALIAAGELRCAELTPEDVEKILADAAAKAPDP